MQIYIACLEAYNSGILHGAWIEPSADAEELQEQIDAMLKRSPMPSAEEWAVHDYNEFPNMGEYPDLEDICGYVELANNTDLPQDCLNAIIENVHGDLDQARKDLERVMGEYHDFQDYADQCADDLIACAGSGQKIELLAQYFDYEQHARDLRHDYTILDVNKGVLVLHH